MKKLEDYTVIELLNMYKDILEPNIESIMCSMFYKENPKNNNFKKMIDEEVEDMKFFGEDKYLKERSKIAYDQTCFIFSRDQGMNDDNNIKISILLELYSRASKTMQPKQLQKLANFILGERKVVIYKHLSQEYSGVEDTLIVTREKQERLQAISDRQYRDCLRDTIDESIAIGTIESSLKAEYGEAVLRAIISKLYIEFFLKQNRMKPREFNEKRQNNEFEKMFDEDDGLREEFSLLLSNYLCNNLQYLDKETVMISTVTRIILGIKIFKGEEFEGIRLGKTAPNASAKQSIKFIKRVYEALKKNNCKEVGYSIFSKEGNEIIHIDMQGIEDFLGRCTEDTYLTDNEIEEIHKNASEGNLTDDIEKRKIAKLNLDDLISANKNYEEKEDESLEKEKILESNIELAKYLLSEEITNKQEILECFMQGNINLELISKIEIEELTEEFFNDKFKNLYFEMVFSQESDEANKTLNKFSTLYSTLLKNNKISVNEDELIDDLVSVLGNEFAAEILADLYNLGVITIEKGIEWVGTDILFEEYKRGNLKPGEVRRLYEDKIINLDGIANVINKLPENGDKFMIIGSIFPEETEEDRDTRDLLIDECLKIDSGIDNGKPGNGRKNGENKTNDYYKHITDPFARISLIKALDKDYSFEMTGDGHAIVKLPSFGKVIIEKMLNKNREPSYGAATYILDEKYYDDNKFRIKKDDKISRHEIIKDIESNKVTRIIHSVKTWGADIKEYFLQTKKVEWSENEIEVIDDAIGRVKRSDPITRDNQQLAKMILNLIVTRKATIEQVEKIAEIYGVDLGKVMDSLDER